MVPVQTKVTDSALASLGRALVPETAQELREGKAQLFKYSAGYFATRGEFDDNGNKELVLIAAEGKDFNPVAHWIVNQCREMGVKFVRFHTARKALARLVSDLKPQLIETRPKEWVYRITIS